MILLLSKQASDSGLAYAFSGWSLSDPITFLPSIGLFILGLVFGLLLFRRRQMAKAGEVFPLPPIHPSEPFVEDLGVGEVREIDSAPSSLAAIVGQTPGPKAGTDLEADLAAAKQMADERAAEIRQMSERFAALRQQLDEKQRRIDEWTVVFDPAKVARQSRSQSSVTQARLPVMQLGESLRSERQWVGSNLNRFENLEMRLREEDERFQAASESLARSRGEVGDRLADSAATGPAIFGLADRLSQVDDHLRVVSQNVRGCVDRIVSAREHLQREQGKLREAAQPISDAEAVFTEEVAEPGDALERTRRLLNQGRERLGQLENGIDQEIAEIVGRVEWTINDSPSAFLKALDRLNSAESRDVTVSAIESRVWQELSELKGSLAAIQLTLETGSLSAGLQGGGKRRLIDLIDRAIESVDDACRAPFATEPEPILVNDPALETENARLRGEVESHTAEIAALRETIAGLETTAAATLAPSPPSQPEPAADTPSLPEPAAPAKTGSRQFIRRLLGLGPGVWEANLAEDELPSAPTASAVATLADARAVVSELRHVPVADRIAERLAAFATVGHQRLPATVPVGVPALFGGGRNLDREEDEEEILRLERDLEERETRIAFLERELEALKQQKAEPAPVFEPVVESEPDLDSIGDFASAAIPFFGIQPGEFIPEDPGEIMLFRGLDPRQWNTRGESARPIDIVPEGIGYLRLKRLDTGESVVTPMTRAELIAGGSAKARLGWSGRGEQYFGACHLGLFDENLPRTVETKFGAGGWGFGHLETGGSGQAYGWAGSPITDPGEGFEISVGFLPDDITVLPRAINFTGQESASGANRTPEQAEALRQMTAQSDNRGVGLVLFRANDPKMWGSETYKGVNCRSRSLSLLPDGLTHLRLRRLDTGEGIVMPLSGQSLTGDGDGLERGFNGSNELFYGAHHLGLFDEALPQDFETRFTFGGWGFGHSISGQDRQSSGWEGQPISSGTVFEIAVFRRLPVLGERDRLLE
jgi:hypothetical protein